MRAALKATAPAAPRTEAQLLARAHALAGRTIGELGGEAGIALPPDTRRDKGIIGDLVEWALGADAGGADAPDFTELGVELKTIPLGPGGKPKESTFVCTIHLDDAGDLEWAQSRACRKLARVLWVPVEAGPELPLAQRRIGAAVLWTPSEAQEAALRADWEELSGLIGEGQLDQITAHLGACLQVRPKAANARVRGNARDAGGAPVRTLPRGFYLRTSFTASVFAEPDA